MKNIVTKTVPFLIMFSPFVQSENLVLWNKLGSEFEVLNSEVGSDFNIELVRIGSYDPEPRVYYVSGMYGDAVATYGGGSYYGGGGRLTMSPNDFFPSDKTKGTVEVWVQKRIQRLVAYRTPLVTLFGPQYYERGEAPSYSSIFAYWADEWPTAEGGLRFIIADDNKYHYATDSEWNNAPIGQWMHTAFVWDLDGIDGSLDKMRIYRDGIITARNTDSIPNILHDTNKVKVLTHHASERFSESTIYLDNIMVWDYAKTNFSDRFRESPNFSPNCDTAEADLKQIWPPNSQWVNVNILNVVDPNDDPVNIQITNITSDEPIAPHTTDAMIENIVWLRAERLGNGDGRVYDIAFTATDSYGAECHGNVTVCVPHDKGKNECIDSGQLYDATR